ncbi:hypothetical protein, partial [Rhizobium ruizarguesonis]|uniref:hypothetical protein n=1 Tax=Rhizobium ruizarguesonis TaxID=2081791 RepID=UPI001953EDD0
AGNLAHASISSGPAEVGAPLKANQAADMIDNQNMELIVRRTYKFAADVGLSFTEPTSFTSLYRILRLAENIKTVLGGSVLPILYGVLGSSVFLLRNQFVSESTNSTPLTATGGALLRLGLGGISGLAIGWFWTPEGGSLAEVKTFAPTPFALAFIAGYSIDLLFSILDRIIGAISPQAGSPQGQPAPANQLQEGS